jgi:uncharacterized protein (DUF433 family)
MITETAKIGGGIYTAADASRIFKIPYTKTKYWFSYYAKNKLSGQIGFQYHFEIKNIIAVNFLTLIEMYVFYTLKDKGVKTSTIIKAHSNMAKFLSTPYPFAQQELYTDGKHLLFGIGNILIQTDKSLQIVIWGILENFLEKIYYSDIRLAKKFYPLGKNNSVVINPENQFGQPIIDGTNILTQTLYFLYKGGEPIESIEKLYNLTHQNIIDAIEFSKAA